MYGTLPYYTLGLLFIDISSCFDPQNNTNFHVSFFEYGVHVEGEQISYAHHGFIPPFTPLFKLNTTPHRKDLEKRFTYLRVEYLSPLSKVMLDFDPKTFILTFHVRFPFLNIPYGVVGFSVKVLRSKIWTSWRRASNHHHRIKYKLEYSQQFNRKLFKNFNINCT